MTETPLYIGIDISKHQLDVVVHPVGPAFTVANTEGGIAMLVEQVRALQPRAVVLEATGDLELPVVSALAAAGLPVRVINPRQVREFARATGQLAKTDALDARMLAQFAEALRPAPRALPDEATQALSAALTRRRQLIEMLTAEKNRRNTARPPVRQGIEAHIDWLTREVRRVEADLDTAIRQSPVWRAQNDLLQSMPVSGRASAARSWRSSLRWGPCPPGNWRRWSGWRRSIATVGPARQTPHLGRPGRGPNGAVHGCAGRHQMESDHQGVLSASAGQRQSQKSRLGGLHA